jgi:hypothetical protein
MVITFWILNGSMVTGCSSTAYGKLQNRVKYYYAFQTYSGLHFVNIFHIIDSPHVSADTFNNYQMCKTSNVFFKSITNSSNIKPCNILWGWSLSGAITRVFLPFALRAGVNMKANFLLTEWSRLLLNSSGCRWRQTNLQFFICILFPVTVAHVRSCEEYF